MQFSVQSKSAIDEVVKTVKRFRILCVGRAGVGKSSLINRVFGVKGAAAADVADWKVGEADIEREYTSTENQFFVLHDSKGFEPGDNKTFDTVCGFFRQRADKRRTLEDRLHAVWLCTQAPKAGGRIFETGDEKLLQLAHETQTPVVIVITKYDQLIRSKKLELQGDNKSLNSEELESLDQRSKVASQEVLDVCVQSLRSAIGRMDAETQMPPWVKISIRPGYDGDIAFLVDATGDLVRKKLEGDAADSAWLMWTIAQRASLPLKIEACIAAGMVYFRKALAGGRFEQTSLRQLLAIIHQDIVTCWNFRDKENILCNKAFDKLIFLLVQDVEGSQNPDSSPAIDKISQVLSVITDADPYTAPDPTLITSADVLEKSLQDTVSNNQAQAQRLFMIYVVVLTTVLKSLFNITLARPSRSSGRMAWSELKGAFETYKSSSSRQQIRSRFYEIFQQDQQILDSKGFQSTFSELVEEEHPHPSLTQNAKRLVSSSPRPLTAPAPLIPAPTAPAPTARAPSRVPTAPALTARTSTAPAPIAPAPIAPAPNTPAPTAPAQTARAPTTRASTAPTPTAPATTAPATTVPVPTAPTTPVSTSPASTARAPIARAPTTRAPTAPAPTAPVPTSLASTAPVPTAPEPTAPPQARSRCRRLLRSFLCCDSRPSPSS